jgi:hypothetical protein
VKRHERGSVEHAAQDETAETFEFRRAHEAMLAGTRDRALLAEHIARARLQRDGARGSAISSTARARRSRTRGPVVLTEEGKDLRVEDAKIPRHEPMFARISACVQVPGHDAIDGILSVPVAGKSLDGLLAGQLRLARWDEDDRRFHLLGGSLPTPDGTHIEGRITRRGTYAVVGLPDDPRVLATMDALRTLGGWLGPDALPGLRPKICDLILCAGPGDGPGGGGGPGDLCALCLGGAGSGLDLDLFDDFSREPGGSFPPKGFPLAPRCDVWESVGPSNVPGRITSLAIDPTNSSVMYAGAAAGGVFKSTTAGSTWEPLWQDQLALAIGGFAIAPSSPQVIYAATGEWTGPNSAVNNHFAGVGVYRTADGGAHWHLTTPFASADASAVAVDPIDPQRAYVAGGMALHRTRDGGQTWDVTSGHTNGVFDGVVTDVVVDPADHLRVYIGVDNDGVWRSLDGGTSWTKLTNGIATGGNAPSPKIALGRSGAHGSQFVAVLTFQKIYTSIDGGNSFTQKTNVPWPFLIGSGVDWCTVLAVDPTNEDVLIGGHVVLARSDNGGAAWTIVAGPTNVAQPVHTDMQAIAFDPSAHDRVYLATDGGVYLSTDNGRNWTPSSTGLVTTQCWTVAASQASGRLAVTTQDNACHESTAGGIFKTLHGGEDGIVEYDANDRIFAGVSNLPLEFSVNDGATWTNIHPNTTTICADLAIARQDPRLLLFVASYDGYYLTNWLFRSADRGTTWSQIFGNSVAPRTSAFAPSSDQHAYVGCVTGALYHSEDAGQTFVALPGTPVSRTVSRIAVDPRDPKRFYVGYGGLGVRHLWRGDIGANAGAVSWTDVTGRLAPLSLPDLPITGLALHPDVDDMIYASNILGVYRSTDGGNSWLPFDDGLPNCFVSDLDTRDLNLGAHIFASTMGRGVYRRQI